MRLQTKILALFLPLALLGGAGLTFLSRREVAAILREQVSQRGISIAQDLAARSRDALGAKDENRLLPLMQSSLPRGALYALALDTEGRVVAHTNVAETGKTTTDPGRGQALNSSDPTTRLSRYEDKPVLEVAVPVWEMPEAGRAEEDMLSAWAGDKRKRGGTLCVGLPLTEAEETERTIARRVFLLVAGIGVLLLGLALLLIHRLLRPVDDLVRAADRLGRGEFGVEVPGAEGPGELGRLAASFNRLSLDLKDQISARQKTQEQLLQSQKMEVIGQLAGGIAHDFNNLLTVIQGYAHLLVEAPEDPDSLRLGVEQIREAAERASSLTRQLLAFSRKQVVQPEVLCLNTTIKSTEKMLQRLVGETVRIEHVLDPALAFLKADPGQIEQVILNLVVNARDAMPHGGKILIETANVVSAGSEDLPAGKWVRLTVKDEGVGMHEALKAHIFEPFFTTKARGKGTGLGLSTVMGIVQQSGGRILVDSAPGKGAAFHVHLAPSEEHVAPARPEDAAWPAGGHETVMVVEDDPYVRLFTRRVLEQGGYSVLMAGGPDEALMALQQEDQKLGLLLTDVVMPRMNGRELAERVSAFMKDVRVLYISGHTDDALLLNGIRSRETAFLGKPFTPEQLLRKVREVLDGAAGAR